MQILTRCTFSPPFFFLPRLQRSNRSPGPGPQTGGRHSPTNAVTSMVSMNSLPDCVIRVPWWECSFFFFLQLSPSFTPTSVIRKMYATKDKSRDESTRLDAKDEASVYTQDGKKH